MDNIYFKKVIASGSGKRESSIEFTKGLNIICGPSNTGKTLVFKIFKQVFGAENKKNKVNDDEAFIIENDTGYTDYSLVISKNDADIILTRKIDSDIISVESHHQNVESGDYTYTNKSGYKHINEALLQIFGVKSFKIPITQDGKSTNFSLKFLDYLFLADEERIDEGNQILLWQSKKYRSTTQSMANLLYLIYGMDFTQFIKGEDLKELKLKQGAVKKYINDKIKNNENKIEEIEKKLEKFIMKGDDSKSIQSHLDKIRLEIDIKYKESAKLEDDIKILTEKMSSDEMLIERLEKLFAQYKSDLERLDFITSGIDELDTNKAEHECPYCHSVVHEEKEQINLEELKSQFNSATHNLEDLSKTLSELMKEHEKDEQELKKLQEQHLNVTLFVNELVEERNNLEYELKEFNELIDYQKQISYLIDDNYSLKKDLDLIATKGKEEREKFNPEYYFKTSFFEMMTNNIKSIMYYCGDLRYESAEFDKVSFDISIKGQSKSANNGKGFRSFLNSVTLFAFRKLLNEEGVNQLPVYVIDSPLKNLDVGDLIENNIKDNFFKYLLESSKSGQLIIIENTNNFTITKELKEKANIIEFTHNKYKGRYGFLFDYHD